MMSLARYIVLVAMAVLSIGVAVAGETIVQAAQTPQIEWQYRPADGAVYGIGQSADGDTLIAAIGYGFEAGGQIVSLDPATGAVLWQHDTPEAASADPIVVDGVVYAGMGNLTGGGAAVYALDAVRGAQLWRTNVENRSIPATPVDAVVYSDGKLFINRGDAALLQIDAATGSIVWELDLQKPPRGAPFVDGTTVYVSTGFDGGRILAIDLATGQEQWSVEYPDNPVTGPVFSEGMLYVPYTDGQMIAYDAPTGAELWRAMVGLRDGESDMNPKPGLPLLADGVLFTSSNGFAGAFTVALDAATGQELWSISTGEFSAGVPVLSGSTLIVGSDSGDLLGLEPATGAELWRVTIPGKIDLDLQQATAPLTANGRIYLIDRDGGVVVLRGDALRSGRI
ncbi:MAG: PQQ-binding-like beta-propeller repeat protein [Thermomicrobiales bacterium]|nr:PQQ-binding-like beta-propeller repeat protein [Thermomicrobiales bacterium]